MDSYCWFKAFILPLAPAMRTGVPQQLQILSWTWHSLKTTVLQLFLHVSSYSSCFIMSRYRILSVHSLWTLQTVACVLEWWIKNLAQYFSACLLHHIHCSWNIIYWCDKFTWKKLILQLSCKRYMPPMLYKRNPLCHQSFLYRVLYEYHKWNTCCPSVAK